MLRSLTWALSQFLPSQASWNQPTAHKVILTVPASMLEPAPSVTQTPIPPSLPIAYRPRPNRDPLQRRSVKGLPPPRSVSSMRTLIPLKLPFSNKYTMQAISQSDFGDSQQMDIVVEPYLSMNVAEALVKDLDASRTPFISRSMTAGCLPEDLATTDVDADDSDSFCGPTIPRYSSPRRQRPGMGFQNNLGQNTDRGDALAVAAEQDAYIRCEGGDFSDSISDSSAAIEPPSVRTRQQSVVTAATSVSAPGSAFASPRILSPASTPSSASFSNKAQQGTWFDADDDSSPTSEGQTGHPLGQSYSLYHRSTVSLSGVDFEHMAAPSDVAANRPLVSTNFHFPLRNPAELQRPQTSTGLPVMEKPRLVDIQPSIAVPRRRSSLKRKHVRLPSLSPFGYHREQPDGSLARPHAAGEMRQDETARLLNASSPMGMLTTSCGRMIIDASRPSSIESGREPPQRRVRSVPQSRLSIANSIESEGEPPADFVFPERPTRFTDQSQNRFDSWFEEGVEHLPPNASQIVPHSPSTPGVPLPPEVLDTLRISLSCFPETMLLTSSLSIETIRTYSRKLRHRVGGRSNQDRQHNYARPPNDDDGSVFSFSSQGTKRPKRWQFRRLVSSHKRDKHSLSNSHMYPDNQLPRSSITSASDTSSPTSPHRQQPMIPDWAPIKRVFPSGSDYLCDALYAHILVYNYLNTLCPMPTESPASSSNKRAQQSQPRQEAVVGGQNRKVPKKAASILGMQDLPGGSANGSMQQLFDGLGHAPNRQTASNRRFKLHKDQDISPEKMSLLSGNGGISPSPSLGHGSGGIETAVIRDLQAGLTRCIGLLVKTLEKGFSTGTDETTFLMEEQQQKELSSRRGGKGDLSGTSRSGHVDSFMMRALCEVVRGSEGGK